MLSLQAETRREVVKRPTLTFKHFGCRSDQHTSTVLVFMLTLLVSTGAQNNLYFIAKLKLWGNCFVFQKHKLNHRHTYLKFKIN